MAVTLHDVAALAGVSIKTVSNVINDYPHIRPATRVKVEQAIAELGYTPNLTARSLRSGRSGAIALASHVAARVMADYQQRLEAAGEEGDVPEKARAEAATERSMRLAALHAERHELYHLRRSHTINDETLRTLIREVDLAEAALTGLHSE